VGTDVAIGELFTTALSGGQATITGIAGTYNGLTITGLLAPGACCEGPAFANDNILFFPGAPGFLDIFGLGFQVEGVTDVNLFLFVGYEDEAAPAGNTAAFAVISDQGTFTVTPVPEPSTLLLLSVVVAGLISLGHKH